jgi:GNAT superfamily N-acetyltransferase
MDLNRALTSVEDFYRRIYWQAHGATTYSTPAYTLSYSGVAWLHSLNQLWLHHPEALDEYLLGLAADFFAEHNAEYSVVFSGDSWPRIAPWLAERHFGERIINPIYALHGPPHIVHSLPDARIIRACIDDQQTLLQVLYGVFFIGPEVGRCAVRPEHFSDPTIRHYLAYVGGEVAGCATLLLHDGIAGVWNVGTLRPFRRQGLASALLARALEDAANDGCPDSVLVASPMGRPLYEELGYVYVGSTYHYGPIDQH